MMLCGHDAVKEALVDQAEEFSGQCQQTMFDWLFKDYGERDTMWRNVAKKMW
jgi:hypothetical protein